ncbi:MAG: HAMP domain-containing histidine kinase [candidate division Zixibacteria bacterium]|nr:HAMP domain-containing histidine kinase [candidate division Zixibacteria bacterium]
MALARKKIGLVMGVIIAALAGLILIQGILLKEAIASRETTFDNTVATTLNRVRETLETVQTMTVIFETVDRLESDSNVNITFTIESDSNKAGGPPGPKSVRVQNDSMVIRTSDDLELVVPIPSQSQGSDSIEVTKILYNVTDSACDVRGYINGKLVDSIPAVMAFLKHSGERAGFVRNVLSRMWVMDSIPLLERLDSALIDSTINATLAESNIDLEYRFGVKIEKPDTMLFVPKSEAASMKNTKYAVRLFPFDVLSGPVELLVQFPDRQAYLWNQVLPMLIISGLFIVAVITGFIYTIRVIVRQQQTQRLMTDFVNNMTHEFKTPISTIALASEAIVREDVISDRARVERFSCMIQDENRRMRSQAEKILQMASLEEGTLHLKKEEVDLKQIIREAVANAELAVKAKDGAIACSFTADEHVFQGDRVHLGGIITNVLDNAVKYSKEKPEITVLTLNADGGLYIRIADRGIGISESDLKLVFNKYYRVSTGDVHNVKGFGLGLSYVKLMVEAHGGKIAVISKPGRGTQVEIFFPLAN